jgi:hypothetical protein
VQPGPPGSIFALKMSETRLSSGRSTGSSPPSDTTKHLARAHKLGWNQVRDPVLILRAGNPGNHSSPPTIAANFAAASACMPGMTCW